MARKRPTLSDAEEAIQLSDQTAAAIKQQSYGSPFTVQSEHNQIPQMPGEPDPTGSPPLDELGGTGTAIFNGIIYGEDYNTDFAWRQGTKIYETMRRNDAQVRATLDMLELPILKQQPLIVPFDDQKDAMEHASFMESALFHRMDMSWSSLLRQILLMLTYGFSVFEYVYKVEDNMVWWQKWAPRLPRTIWRWWIGADNDLAGIQQFTFINYGYRYINIPAWKLIRFAHRQEGNNFEGQSVLRSAYKHWYFKDRLYAVEAIGIERAHVQVPIIRLPENYNQNDLTNAQNMGANIRANEALYLTLPPGFDAEWMGVKGRPIHVDIQNAINHHDQMISRNILAQFINLGSTETGAYALATVLLDVFLLALQSVIREIEDRINSEAIPRLINMNYTGVRGYPRLNLGEVNMTDLSVLAPALQKLAQVGLVEKTPELVDYLHEVAGIPRTAKSAVVNTDPGSPAGPSAPLPGRGPDERTESGSATEQNMVATP